MEDKNDTYYIPHTGDPKDNLLNASDTGHSMIKTQGGDVLHNLDNIDSAEKYLIRHKFGEHIREGEDIDLDKMPANIAL